MLRVIWNGGQVAKPGTYWNFSTGERISLGVGAILPGDNRETFCRLPPVAMLLAAPILGLVYAIFLPFIGIAMGAGLVGKALFTATTDALHRASTFGWQPSEAYLLGRKIEKLKKEKKAEEEVDETQDEAP